MRLAGLLGLEQEGPRPYFRAYWNGKGAVDVTAGGWAPGVHGWRGARDFGSGSGAAAGRAVGPPFHLPTAGAFRSKYLEQVGAAPDRRRTGGGAAPSRPPAWSGRRRTCWRSCGGWVPARTRWRLASTPSTRESCASLPRRSICWRRRASLHPRLRHLPLPGPRCPPGGTDRVRGPADGRLRPDRHPGARTAPRQLVGLPDGRLLVRHRRGLESALGGQPAEAEALLERVDGERTAAAVVTYPDARRARGCSRRSRATWCAPVGTRRRGRAGPAPGVVVLASGSGGAALAERLRAERRARGAQGRVAPGEGEGTAGVARSLEGAALVVAALEEVAYRRLFALEQSCLERGVPVLFVTADPDGVRVGPAVLPGGATPCLECSLVAALAAVRLPRKETLEAGARLATGTLEPARAHGDVGARVAREVTALLGGTGRDPEPRCLGELVLLRPEGPLGPLRVPAQEELSRVRRRRAEPGRRRARAGGHPAGRAPPRPAGGA